MDQDSGRENLGTETQSIQRWVDRLRRGDETARDELFHAAHRRMSRLAVHLLKQFPGVARWEQTDDLVARASMRLLSALESVGLTDARHFLRLAAQHMRWELRDLARHYHGPHGLGKHHHTSVGRRDGEEEQPAGPIGCLRATE